MVKKINSDAIAIKTLLDKGYTQARICRLLGLKKQKVSYWANTPIKTEIKRRTKLNEEYKKKLLIWQRINLQVIWEQEKLLILSIKN